MNDRRRLLQLLLAGGVLGSGAAAALQGEEKLTSDILETFRV